MAILVDSNVILDVATEDPNWGEWSAQALARAANESVLGINPIVFAEVSVGFGRVEELEDAHARLCGVCGRGMSVRYWINRGAGARHCNVAEASSG